MAQPGPSMCIEGAFAAASVAACWPEAWRDPVGGGRLLLLSCYRAATALYALATGIPRRDEHVLTLWLGHLVWQSCVCLGLAHVTELGTRLVEWGTFFGLMVYLETINQV
jgi:hypothetical protein